MINKKKKIKNSMKRIYLIGENHASGVTGKILERFLKKNKIDAILSEGFQLNKFYSFRNVIMHPLLAYALTLWKIFMLIYGRSSKDVKQIAEKYSIPLLTIDAKPSELLKNYRRWYDYPLMIAVISFCFWFFWLKSPNTLLYKVIALIIPGLVYMLLVALNTMNFRNAKFFENSRKIMENKNYHSVILICGKGHLEGVKELLSNRYYVKILGD